MLAIIPRRIFCLPVCYPKIYRLRCIEPEFSLLLRRIFGPERDAVTREWRKLHHEEFTDLNSSPNIIRVIKSRRMRWAGHVVRRGTGELYTGFRWLYLRERDHLEEPDIDGKMILRLIFRKLDVGVWTGSICLRIVTGVGLLYKR